MNTTQAAAIRKLMKTNPRVNGALLIETLEALRTIRKCRKAPRGRYRIGTRRPPRRCQESVEDPRAIYF
jgi:hypothetical protein